MVIIGMVLFQIALFTVWLTLPPCGREVVFFALLKMSDGIPGTLREQEGSVSPAFPAAPCLGCWFLIDIEVPRGRVHRSYKDCVRA